MKNRTDLSKGRVDRLSIFPLPPDIIVKRDVRVAMPDGTELSLNIFLPRHGDQLMPVVMALTRYDKDDPPVNYMAEGSAMRRSIGLGLGDISVSDATPFEAPDPAFWVAHGYGVIHADARGTGKSAGEGDTYSPRTVDDFCCLVEWAADQPWSNGRVGLCGVSYLAIIQYLVAAKSPRGLAAIIPWEGMADRYRDVAFPGGIPETSFSPWIREGGKGIPGSDAPPRFDAPNSPLADKIDLLKADLELISVPMLSCVSWSDQGLHTRGSLDAFLKASSTENRLFTHGRGKWTVFHSLEASYWQRAFFDCHLKQERRALDGFPRVRLETRRSLTECDVRYEDQWPPAGYFESDFYLDAAGANLTKHEVKAETVVCLESPNDVIDFSICFDHPVEITGGACATLCVSTDNGDDIDLFVALRKLDAYGQEVNFEGRENSALGPVALGWLRVSHREVDENASTAIRPIRRHDKLLPVLPNERYLVDVEILPSSTYFEAGSQLVLSVSGADIYDNRMCQHHSLRNCGRISIYTGPEATSRLRLPLIEKWRD